MKASDPDRIHRVECLPGEEAQVHFGSGYYLEEQGKKGKVNLLREVLSCSRKAYTETVPRQTSTAFIRCLENAFRSFRGVVHSLVIDNLLAAVKKADWYEPELCPKVKSFTHYYGTVILPCRVRTPEHKGKAENSIKYLKSSALKGRRVFGSLQALNQHLRTWEALSKMGARISAKCIQWVLSDVLALRIRIAAMAMLIMYHPAKLQTDIGKMIRPYSSGVCVRNQIGAKVDHVLLTATARQPSAIMPPAMLLRFAA